MSVRLYRSNRLEQLADAFAASLDASVGDPIRPDRLVVQSAGMFEWVAAAMAERRGIAANLAWWRPRQMVEELLKVTLDDHKLRLDAWSRERLTWVLMRLLPEVLDQPGYEVLAAWLDGDPERRFQLARRIAHVFDQYTVYRADTVLKWEAGEEDHWQARLWRRLSRELEGGHLAQLVDRAHRRLQGARPDWFPRHLHLFGLTTIPPLYLDLLGRMTDWCKVSLYQLSPSREWFADIHSKREIARRLKGFTPDHGPEAEEAHHFEEGHPLLSRLGRVGRDFQGVLEATLDYAEDDVDRFRMAGTDTLLGRLQDDLLTLDNREGDARHRIRPADRSVEIHGCHSAIREVEVLRDRLHAWFEADPTLRPRDVVVLMPDINEHGPLVEAVFGVGPDDPVHIPYTIADRPLASGNVVARSLLAVLDLVGSRMEASAVLELLSHAPIRERFDVDERDLDHVQEVLHEAGIRWGLDAGHRASVGQPEDPVGTWQYGLDRLVLGHALGGVDPVAGAVPVEGVDEDAVPLLRRLLHLHGELVARLRTLERPRPVETWQRDLSELLDALFGDGPEHFEALQGVRTALADAAEQAREAEYTAAVPLALMRDMMDRHLATERRPGGFLRAGVTFCEMLPMRAIPFQVVCLLGLSDGAFPRTDHQLGFDLIAAQPRPGDRSKRLDDRYLVLEAVLSARRALLATYRSRSVTDNSELPPSVVLSELMDVLEASTIAESGSALDQVLVEHPLQPFSPTYMADDPQLFTYDAMAGEGAAALHEAGAQPTPFFEGLLPETPLETVDVTDLVRFLQDGVLWFLADRLGVRPVREAELVRDREPLEVRELDDYTLGSRVLRLRLDGLDDDAAWQIVRAESRLPAGAIASVDRDRIGRAVRGLLDLAEPRRVDPEPPLTVLEDLGDVQLTGVLEQVYGAGRVEVSYRNAVDRRARILVGPWVRHLALQLVAEDGRATEVYGRVEEGRPGLVGALPAMSKDEARARLSDLIRWYRIGMREPVWFLPDASWAWLRKKGRHGQVWDAFNTARSTARQVWRTDTASKRAWTLLAGGEDAFDPGTKNPRVAEAAEALLGPLRHVLGGSR
jgi:exodeoxyribonuclease V gamma subunit